MKIVKRKLMLKKAKKIIFNFNFFLCVKYDVRRKSVFLYRNRKQLFGIRQASAMKKKREFVTHQ